jgi:hypothetical protein
MHICHCNFIYTQFGQNCSLCIFIVMSYCMFMYLLYVYVFILFLCIFIVPAATLTEVFPCFFLSCKANTRVKPTMMGHGQHYSKFLCFSMYCFFFVILCIVWVYMCTELLPPNGYPTAVNKYIISYHRINHRPGHHQLDILYSFI